MKKLIKITILLLAIFVSGRVYAAGVTVSASSANIYVGDNATFNVTVFAGTWNLNVTGAATDQIIGFDMDKNTTTTRTYPIDTSKPGKYTIYVKGDVTDYDTDVNSNIAKSYTVTVNNRPAEPTPTTQVVTTTTATKTTRVAQTAPPTTVTQQIEETTTTEPITTQVEEVKGEEEMIFDIDRFEIIGYDINFDTGNHEYVLNLDPRVTKLYIVVEGADLEVVGDKEVSIVDKDEILVSVKKGNVTRTFTIKLDRSNELDSYKKSNKGLKICILILSIVLLGFGAFMLYMFKFRK